MKRLLFSTVVLLASLVQGPSSQAAVVNVTGAVTLAIGGPHGGADVGSTFAFQAAFNTIGGPGTVGAITSVTFVIAGETYTQLGTGTASISNDGASGDLLNFNVNLNPSNPGGFAGGNLSLSVFSNPADNSIVADNLLTEANVSSFAANANGGNFLWTPGTGPLLIGDVAGTAVVPEPSSVIMMAGVGLFFVVGAVRRRKKQNAEQLEAIAV